MPNPPFAKDFPLFSGCIVKKRQVNAMPRKAKVSRCSLKTYERGLGQVFFFAVNSRFGGLEGPSLARWVNMPAGILIQP